MGEWNLLKKEHNLQYFVSKSGLQILIIEVLNNLISKVLTYIATPKYGCMQKLHMMQSHRGNEARER